MSIDYCQQKIDWNTATALLAKYQLEQQPYTLVANKCDTSGWQAGGQYSANRHCFTISALNKDGLEALIEQLGKELALNNTAEGSQFIARKRHVCALAGTTAAIRAAHYCLTGAQGAELIAEELRRAHRFLEEIVGGVDYETMLGQIFSNHCIGK